MKTHEIYINVADVIKLLLQDEIISTLPDAEAL